MLLLYSAGHSATSQSAGYHEGCSIQDMPGAYRPPGRRSSRAERCKPTGAGWADRAGLTRPNSASNSGPDWTGAASLVWGWSRRCFQELSAGSRGAATNAGTRPLESQEAGGGRAGEEEMLEVTADAECCARSQRNKMFPFGVFKEEQITNEQSFFFMQVNWDPARISHVPSWLHGFAWLHYLMYFLIFC